MSYVTISKEVEVTAEAEIEVRIDACCSECGGGLDVDADGCGGEIEMTVDLCRDCIDEAAATKAKEMVEDDFESYVTDGIRTAVCKDCGEALVWNIDGDALSVKACRECLRRASLDTTKVEVAKLAADAEEAASVILRALGILTTSVANAKGRIELATPPLAEDPDPDFTNDMRREMAEDDLAAEQAHELAARQRLMSSE